MYLGPFRIALLYVIVKSKTAKLELKSEFQTEEAKRAVVPTLCNNCSIRPLFTKLVSDVGKAEKGATQNSLGDVLECDSL